MRDLRALLQPEHGDDPNSDEKVMYVEEAPAGLCSVCGGVDRCVGLLSCV